MAFDLNKDKNMVKDDKKFSKLAQITAEKELMETAFRREQALATMKDFVQKHPHLRDVRSGKITQHQLPLFSIMISEYDSIQICRPGFR